MYIKKFRLLITSLILLLSYFGYVYISDTTETSAQAIKRGVPNLDAPWIVQDQEDYLAYLRSLPIEIDLPKYGSFKSGTVFKKYLTSLDDIITVKTGNMDSLSRAINIKTIAAQVLKVYTTRHEIEPLYNAELAYMYGLQLEASFYMQETSKTIIKNTSENDPYLQKRQEGMRMIEEGVLMQIKITLHLFKQKYFSNNEVLTEYFKKYVPQIWKFLESSTRENLKQALINEQAVEHKSKSKLAINKVLKAIG